jgi:hypothetical protein
MESMLQFLSQWMHLYPEMEEADLVGAGTMGHLNSSK